jgi:hypothetical protein
LDELVGSRRYPKWTEFSAFLGDVNPACRFRAVFTLAEYFTDEVHSIADVGMDMSIDPGSSGPFVPADFATDLVPEVWIVGHQLKHSLHLVPVA